MQFVIKTFWAFFLYSHITVVFINNFDFKELGIKKVVKRFNSNKSMQEE